MPEVLGAGRFLRLVVRDGWEWAERVNATGVVVVLAVTAEGKLLFVEQHRPPVGCRVLEFPAGLAGDDPGASGEGLADAAARELEEETGYRPASMELLTEGPVSAGMTSEVLTMFRARGLVRVSTGGGVDGEDIVVHEVPVAEAFEWLAKKALGGVPCDPKVYAGLYFLSRG